MQKRLPLLCGAILAATLSATPVQAEKFAIEQVLQTPNPSEFAFDSDSTFGRYADQDGDTAVIADNAAKRVEVFTRQADGSWQHLQTLTVPVDEFTTPITSYFANHVAIEGDTIVIGDTDARGVTGLNVAAGVVYIFRRQADGSWSYDSMLGNPVDADPSYDHFGSAIDIENGVMVIGASDDGVTDTGFKLGSAFVFKRDASGNWGFHKHLVPNVDETDMVYLGLSVATDGNRVIVGGPTNSGLASAIGVVYIYEVDGDGVTRLPTPAAGEEYSIKWGTGVDIHGDFAFIGAPHYSDPPSFYKADGIVYAYKYNGDSWQELTTLDWPTDPNGFGFDVDFDGTDLVVSGNSGSDRIHYFHYDSVNQQFDVVRSWQATDIANDIGSDLGMANVHITSSGNLIATADDSVLIYEAEAQLQLVVQDDTDPVTKDAEFGYTITVTNVDSEVTATGVKVSASLPDSFTLVQNDAACSDDGTTTITCEIASLAPGAVQSFEIRVSGSTDGSYTFSPELVANEWLVDGPVISDSETTVIGVSTSATESGDGDSGGGGGGSVSPSLLLTVAGLLYLRRRKPQASNKAA